MCGAMFDLCEVFGGGSAPHHCTYNCNNPNQCPVPATGTATIICGGPQNDTCMLDCEAGTCPDGMSCISTGQAGMDKRCAYNP